MCMINLAFKNTTVALAGNPYGKRVFNDQVKPKLTTSSADDKITISLPPQITYVTSSFIQGFFDYWLRTMGYAGIKRNITIQSDNDRVVQYIWNNLL